MDLKQKALSMFNASFCYKELARIPLLVATTFTGCKESPGFFTHLLITLLSFSMVFLYDDLAYGTLQPSRIGRTNRFIICCMLWIYSWTLSKFTLDITSGCGQEYLIMKLAHLIYLNVHMFSLLMSPFFIIALVQ